jgi:hypothetical protein
MNLKKKIIILIGLLLVVLVIGYFWQKKESFQLVDLSKKPTFPFSKPTEEGSKELFLALKKRISGIPNEFKLELKEFSQDIENFKKGVFSEIINKGKNFLEKGWLEFQKILKEIFQWSKDLF